MTQRHDDFAFEPLPGLPARPPKGEEVLWQGRPRTFALAREAMGLNWIAGWFALLTVWKFGAAVADASVVRAVAVALPYLAVGLIVCLIVLGIAWVQARTTVYTITTARVAMRIGAALSVTLNVPFAQLANAGLDLRKDGTGTIALEPRGDVRISYLICWPHVRPWHMRKTEPALRAIPDAAQVARLLADAAETRVSMPVVAASGRAPAPDLVAAE